MGLGSHRNGGSASECLADGSGCRARNRHDTNLAFIPEGLVDLFPDVAGTNHERDLVLVEELLEALLGCLVGERVGSSLLEDLLDTGQGSDGSIIVDEGSPLTIVHLRVVTAAGKHKGFNTVDIDCSQVHSGESVDVIGVGLSNVDGCLRELIERGRDTDPCLFEQVLAVVDATGSCVERQSIFVPLPGSGIDEARNEFGSA